MKKLIIGIFVGIMISDITRQKFPLVEKIIISPSLPKPTTVGLLDWRR